MIDFATALGLLFGLAITLFLMLSGSEASLFLNYNALLIILGGVFAATLLRFPFKALLSNFWLGLSFAFVLRSYNPQVLINELAEVALAKRKALPLPAVSHPLLKRGVKMVGDGFDSETIRLTLERERDTHLLQLEESSQIFRSIGESAPAFGMIGTLIGMVQMFANMQDPTSLGPYMASALLATLYGALISNIIALPLADKLENKVDDEDRLYTLIIEGVVSLKAAKSSLYMRESLAAFLPSRQKEEA